MRGVSDFIREQLVVLENIARVLNREAVGEWPEERHAAVAQAAAVVEAALGSRYPTIPAPAADAFDDLAKGQPLEYASRSLFRRGHVIRLDHRTPVHLVGPSWRGMTAVWLAAYFMHPSRDRLRRCQQCARWFVDMTRNKSSLRCSRACTIAWSNSQRPRKTKKRGK
jgi:predicted RNA-binding Zn ribbon-like protein